jgi:hypothetical protein
MYVNWLNTNSGSRPAYKFNITGGGFISMHLWAPTDPGYDTANLFRNSQAKYFLPSLDEWYKAAYYDPINGIYYDYPTGSDTIPTGVTSGTLPGTAVIGLSLGNNGPADVNQAGGLSPYGTMAQGGNVAEILETAYDLVNNSANESRMARGGDWANDFTMLSSRYVGVTPALSFPSAGFRVVSIAIPEPSMLVLVVCGLTSVLGVRRKSIR